MSAPAFPGELAQHFDDLLDEALAEAAEARSAADLEQIAATVILAFDDPAAPEEYLSMLPAALEHRGDVAAARVLAATTVLARPTLRRLAEGARERLRTRGVVPTGVRSLGTLEVEDARLISDATGEILAVVLRRPSQRQVQLALVGIEDRGEGGVIVHAELGAPDREARVRAGLASADTARANEPIGRRELLDRLLDATANTAARGCAMPLDAPFCLATLSRALTGDTDAFPHLEVHARDPLEVDPIDDEEGYEALLDQLVRDFGEHVRARHGTEGPIWGHGEFASCTLLEWKGAYADGHLGHWTSADLREFLLEYAPRKLTMEPEAVGVLPLCVAEVLRFLDGAGALTGDPLEELIAECEALRPRFERANADRRNWGLAKSMATQMLAEGVDPGDDAAVRAWMEQFNARPRAERDRVIAGARPELRMHLEPTRKAASHGTPASRPNQDNRAKRRSARSARKGNRRHGDRGRGEADETEAQT